MKSFPVFSPCCHMGTSFKLEAATPHVLRGGWVPLIHICDFAPGVLLSVLLDFDLPAGLFSLTDFFRLFSQSPPFFFPSSYFFCPPPPPICRCPCTTRHHSFGCCFTPLSASPPFFFSLRKPLWAPSYPLLLVPLRPVPNPLPSPQSKPLSSPCQAELPWVDRRLSYTSSWRRGPSRSYFQHLWSLFSPCLRLICRRMHCPILVLALGFPRTELFFKRTSFSRSPPPTIWCSFPVGRLSWTGRVFFFFFVVEVLFASVLYGPFPNRRLFCGTRPPVFLPTSGFSVSALEPYPRLPPPRQPPPPILGVYCPFLPSWSGTTCSRW